VIKRSGFVVRRPDLSVEEFRRYWIETHAPLVREVARPHRYTVNWVDRDRFPDFPYDGFSELWFESADDMTVFGPDSPIKQDEENFAHSVVVVTLTEQEVVT
jgi:uncharacterized protein (TIGR02118 family)